MRRYSDNKANNWADLTASIAKRDPMMALAAAILYQCALEAAAGVDEAIEWLTDPYGGGLFAEVLDIDSGAVAVFSSKCQRRNITPLWRHGNNFIKTVKDAGGEYLRRPDLRKERKTKNVKKRNSFITQPA